MIELNDDHADRPAPRPARTPCVGCGCSLTWAQQRKQYGRLRKMGYDHDQASYAMPRCQKCTTKWLRTSAFARIWMMAIRGGKAIAATGSRTRGDSDPSFEGSFPAYRQRAIYLSRG